MVGPRDCLGASAGCAESPVYARRKRPIPVHARPILYARNNPLAAAFGRPSEVSAQRARFDRQTGVAQFLRELGVGPTFGEEFEHAVCDGCEHVGHTFPRFGRRLRAHLLQPFLQRGVIQFRGDLMVIGVHRSCSRVNRRAGTERSAWPSPLWWRMTRVFHRTALRVGAALGAAAQAALVAAAAILLRAKLRRLTRAPG